MATKDDGGPAFPRPGYYPDDPGGRMEARERLELRTEPQPGLSLRDYFAAAALTGLLAWSPPNVNADDGEPISGNVEPDTAAGWAYEYADEMLAARRAAAR